jgi:hypothetical protein
VDLRRAHNGDMRIALLLLAACAGSTANRPDVSRIAGGVGLWVDSQPGSFANLQIRPAA